MKVRNIVKRSNEIMERSQNCYFGVIDEDGFPHVATRSFCQPPSVHGCYISTNYSGNLARTIMNDSKASVCVNKGDDNITMIGNAKIINDKKIKKDFWLDWFIEHYPGGSDDPEYCIIEFKTTRLSLWVDHHSEKLNVREIKVY